MLTVWRMLELRILQNPKYCRPRNSLLLRYSKWHDIRVFLHTVLIPPGISWVFAFIKLISIYCSSVKYFDIMTPLPLFLNNQFYIKEQVIFWKLSQTAPFQLLAVRLRAHESGSAHRRGTWAGSTFETMRRCSARGGIKTIISSKSPSEILYIAHHVHEIW